MNTSVLLVGRGRVTFVNICAKNDKNQTIRTRVIAKNVTDLFFEMQCSSSPNCHQGGKLPCKVKVAHTRRVRELILVLGSQPSGDVSNIPGGRLPLLSARPAVILATLKRAATNFAAW